MPTDKTDGISFQIETIESYKLAAEEHVKDDATISEKERKHIDANYNGIAIAMNQFLTGLRHNRIQN